MWLHYVGVTRARNAYNKKYFFDTVKLWRIIYLQGDCFSILFARVMWLKFMLDFDITLVLGMESVSYDCISALENYLGYHAKSNCSFSWKLLRFVAAVERLWFHGVLMTKYFTCSARNEGQYHLLCSSMVLWAQRFSSLVMKCHLIRDLKFIVKKSDFVFYCDLTQICKMFEFANCCQRLKLYGMKAKFHGIWIWESWKAK